MTINTKTTVRINETRNGSHRAETYETEAGRFVQGEWDADCDGNLPANLFDLPVENQLDLACERRAERFAARVSWAA